MKWLNPLQPNRSKRHHLITLLSTLVLLGLCGSTAFTQPPQPIDTMQTEVTQGALRVKVDAEVVECPLKHTDVKVNISGFIARVTVTQTFSNPYDEKIEAVYVFPLPHTAAVDDMTMRVGERRIVGVIQRRAEARAIYAQAVQQGKTASLLEQERPNIFTQAVGNIPPGEQIHIEISYVDVLNYDMGTYEFHFPMVVGPRYIPGTPTSKTPPLPPELRGKVGEIEAPFEAVTEGATPSGSGWSPDTTRVPDAARITPPVLKPGYRTAHDISLSVLLNAGVPIQDIQVVSHEAAVMRAGKSRATVVLAPTDAIPNKDFVMKYAVAGEKPELALFAHAEGPEQRYFMLIIQPQLDTELLKAPPRELVFLIDASGSMSGEPTEKVKQTMRHFLRRTKPDDTLQLIRFANQATQLFENSVPATKENVSRARAFIERLQGSGGTEMLRGIKRALNAPVDPARVRIVVLLTDGAIGNEAEILEEVSRRAGDLVRFWTIGIGSASNRFLIDGVAKQGSGMSGVLGLNSDPAPLVTQIVERIHRAQLAQLAVDWNHLPVYETYPRRMPELWAGHPVILFGRYAAGGSTEIALAGIAEGKPLTYKLAVTLPDEAPEHAVLAKVWARQKIADLSAQMYSADTPEIIEEITQVALDSRLMSQYTSFVAVDESDIHLVKQQATPPRQVIVPVPLPAGVKFEGVFGQYEEEPQFFYDLFGKESLEGGKVYNAPASSSTKRWDAELVVGWTGQFDRGKVAAPRHGRRNGLNEAVRSSPHRFRSGFRSSYAESSFGSVYDWDDVSYMSGFQENEYQKAAQAALAAAQALHKQGQLESVRLRYQHALGLAAALYDDKGTSVTSMEAIRNLNEEIAKKRAKAYPRLNRKLEIILRNQPLADAIRTLVNGAGFQLELVPGSLKDVAALLNVQELRVTYLDLRQTTLIQGLDWLLAPYHLTWEVKAPDTITVGTARRLPSPSVWGYDVLALAMSLDSELDEDAPWKSIENEQTAFLNAIRIVINQKEEGIQPGSAMLLDAKCLLVYGAPEIHQKVERLLEALRDGKSNVTRVAGRNLAKDEAAALKVLQKLTSARWKTRAEAQETRTAAEARQRLVTDVATAAWQLLAEAIKGKVDLEALTRLQMNWAAPRMPFALESKDLLLVMRSAWCIRTAAQAVPTDAELATLSQSVLSKLRKFKLLKPQQYASTDYLGTLYAVLALPVEDRGEAREALLAVREHADIKMAQLIAEGLLSPSEKSDKALAAALSAHQIYDEDLLLLASLVAKRRGGQLWQTFREELPNLVRQIPLNGQVVVILNRLQALHTEI